MVWDGQLLDTDWVYVGGAGAPAFQTGWVDYATSGGTGGYVASRFRRLNGVVHVQLMATGGTNNAIVFTLPAKFRPAAAIPPFTGVDGSNTPRRFDLNTAGEVRSTGATSNGFLSCVVSFPAEA